MTLISFLYSFITFIRFCFLIVFSMSMFVCLSAVVAAVLCGILYLLLLFFYMARKVSHFAR